MIFNDRGVIGETGVEVELIGEWEERNEEIDG